VTNSPFIGPVLNFDPEDWGRPVNNYLKKDVPDVNWAAAVEEAKLKFSPKTFTESAEKLAPVAEKVVATEAKGLFKSAKGLIGKVTPWDVTRGAARFAAINMLFPGSFWQNAAASGGFEATRLALKNRGYGGLKTWIASAAVSASINALIGTIKPKESIYPAQQFANRFSGKDDAYNTISGLRDAGMAQDIRHGLTQFGSGYDASRPLPTSLMGVPIDPRILKFRQEVIDNPEERAELEARLKEKAAAAQANLGDFTEDDFTSIDLGSIEGLNLQNKNLRAINLSKFSIEAEDADTLTLQRKGLAGFFSDPIQVRLSGIDAPETASHSNDPMEEVRIWQGQAGGKWSTAAFQKLLAEQKNLSLVIDTQNKTYGRSLGTLIGDGNENINLELIRSGIVSALPFGKTETDVISRSEAAQAEKQAVSQDAGIWGFSRYRAIKEATNTLGNAITYNTLTEINKLSQNLTLGAYGSFLQGFGEQQRALTPEETAISRRFGYALRKSHAQPRFQQRWSGRDDNYNTIEGLRHGGMAEDTRHTLTEFGSGWDIARTIAKKMYKGVGEGKAFKLLRESDEWVNMLSSAKELKQLHYGSYGTTYLMEGTLRGESFKFVKKIPKTPLAEDFIPGLPNEAKRIKALKGEYKVMPRMENRIAPSPYGYNKAENALYMEYMEGQTLHDLVTEGKTKLPTRKIMKTLKKEISKAAKLGVKNVDIHSGNIMFDPATGRVSWIDWGLASSTMSPSKKWTKQSSDEMLRSAKDKLSKQLKARIAPPPSGGFMDFGDLNEVIKSSSPKSSFDASALTIDARSQFELTLEMEKESIARNRRFARKAKDAVGVGHRAAYNAGRKHSKFSSINSA